MIEYKCGNILLVLGPAEAELIVEGLDEIIHNNKYSYDDKKVVRASHLADYIERRLMEVVNYEAE